MALCSGKPLSAGEALAIARPALALCGVGLQEVPDSFEAQRRQLAAAQVSLSEVVATLQDVDPNGPAGPRGFEACRGANAAYKVAVDLGGPPGGAFAGQRSVLGLALGAEKDNVVQFPGGMGAATEAPVVDGNGPAAPAAPAAAPRAPAPGVPRPVVIGIILGALTFGVGLGAALVSGRREARDAAPSLGDDGDE